MNISQFMDYTLQKVDQIDWKKATKEGIALWVALFKVMVTLAVITYLAGKSLGNWVHRLNYWLAQQWVRLIVPSPSVETGQVPIVEEVLNNTPAVAKVELMLPPAPLVVKIQAEQEKQTPTRRLRRNSAKEAPLEVVQAESATVPTRRPRGRRAHDRRHQVA